MFVLDDKTYEFVNGVYFMKVKDYYNGDSFGEMALLKADCLRNASIKCETDCLFASLNRSNFNKTLKLIEDRY